MFNLHQRESRIKVNSFNKVKVSVVMSNFNNGEFIYDSINSILNQEFDSFELIIVDDGSTDNSLEIIKSFEGGKVRAIYLEKNCGLGVGINIAIGHARGDYIAIMDADDISFPLRLKKESDFLDSRPDIDIVGTQCIRIKDVNSEIIDQPTYPTQDFVIKATMLSINGSCMIHPTTMIRRAFINQANIAYPIRKLSEDTAFWIKCVAKKAKFACLDEPLLYKRRHATNVHQIQKFNMDKEKTPLRVELLSLYYPDLTNHETFLLARSMEIQSNISIHEYEQILSIIKKTLSEKRSFYGESKEILNLILANQIKKISTSFGRV